MPLPPLYKFMGVEGAKATLQTRSFRHAKPSTFNDIEDLTIQSLFPEDVEAALKKVWEGMPRVILQHLDDVPTCKPGLAESIKKLQAAYRAKPELAALMDEGYAQAGVAAVTDVDAMRALASDMITVVNDFLQGYRVFCVTAHRDSEKMWRDYAEQHRGIAVRIQPNIEKDSHLRLFRQVEYREKRPSLYDDTMEFMSGALFGDQEVRNKKMVEKIIYTKTLNWQDEGEYRVAAPVAVDDGPWDGKFHADEISELYLGSAMYLADMSEIIKRARRANPNIVIFQAERGDTDALVFRKL